MYVHYLTCVQDRTCGSLPFVGFGMTNRSWVSRMHPAGEMSGLGEGLGGEGANDGSKRHSTKNEVQLLIHAMDFLPTKSY